MTTFLIKYLSKGFLLFGLILSTKGFAFDQNEINQEEINQRIEQLQQQMQHQLDKPHATKIQCTNCPKLSVSNPNSESHFFVFVSFSMPDSLWVSLSQELEAVGGVFVIQGLPTNSFKELAHKIYELRQKNVNADIQLHPQLFQDYEIHHVPTFVVQEEEEWHKLAGSVSVAFALEQFKQKCQSKIASSLLIQLKEGN